MTLVRPCPRGSYTTYAWKRASPSDLSGRELEVLATFASCDSCQAMAEALGISRQTLEVHMRSIRRKLGKRTMLAVAVLAIRKGFVTIGLEEVSALAHPTERMATSRLGDRSYRRCVKVGPYGLTKRELQMISSLAHCGSYREIAAALCVDIETVRRHLANIYNKVGADSLLGLLTWAVRKRLLHIAVKQPPCCPTCGAPVEARRT